MNFITRLIFFSCTLLLFIGTLKAQSPVYYKGEQLTIGKNIGILTDPDGSMTPASALASGKFEPNTKPVPNLDITDKVYWIRFSIVNLTNTPRLAVRLANPTVDSLSVFIIRKGVIADTWNSGDLRLYADRQVNHQTFIRLLDAPLNDTVQCLLRVRSGEQLTLPIEVGSEEQMTASVLRKDILFGLYGGIMIAMILYNLFIYFTVKDRSYLLYVGYLILVFLTQVCLEGYLFRFVLPAHPYAANLFVYISSALVGLSAIEFTKHFLNSKVLTPGLRKVSWLFWVLYTMSLACAFTGRYNISYTIILASAMLSAIYVIVIGVVSLRRGSRAAKYFLIGWTVFIFCVIAYVLKDFNIIPYNTLTATSLEWGSAFEAIMLSFALADKINVLEAQRKKAQLEALEAAQENARIIREQNVILEAKVEERTHDLSVALHELKEAQAQLVEAEKMASLGQLTAGIAHEINNPINFVTSNVRPLRRDIELLFEAFNRVAALVIDNEATDKAKIISDIKAEIEYDYLVEEIDFLLKGISEGSERTAEIVKGLRIFSRVDEDDLKKADLKEGLESTAVIVNTLLNNRIVIRKDYGDVPMIECYPGKLNQVFLNIISNAIYAIQEKFGDHSGGEIYISTEVAGDRALVKIRDNGQGMDETTVGRIFEPFFTTKEVGEGTGLGLSIVYNIIKKHNGIISVNSVRGEGTEFVIDLPLLQQTGE